MRQTHRCSSRPWYTGGVLFVPDSKVIKKLGELFGKLDHFEGRLMKSTEGGVEGRCTTDGQWHLSIYPCFPLQQSKNVMSEDVDQNKSKLNTKAAHWHLQLTCFTRHWRSLRGIIIILARTFVVFDRLPRPKPLCWKMGAACTIPCRGLFPFNNHMEGILLLNLSSSCLFSFSFFMVIFLFFIWILCMLYAAYW